MSGFIGAGDVYLNPYNAAGVLQGWGSKLYAARFEVQANAELQELTSKGRDDYGQVIGSVSIQQPADFRMTLRDADKDALTLLFLGSSAALSVAGAAITDEVLNIKKGKSGRTAKGHISATTLTSSPAGTNYVLGTDYTISNARLGLITPIAGSSLETAVNAAGANGLNLLIDYTYATLSGTTITGGTQPSLRAQVMFDGKNVESGEALECEVWEVVMRPDAGFDFLGDDWAEVPLTGRMKTPSGKSGPFEIRFPVAS